MGSRRPAAPRSDASRAVARTFLALGAVALLACGPGGGSDAPAPGDARSGQGGRPQRIVLLTLDTLRADRLEPGAMPHTDAFAARGLRFGDFWAASSATQPTHATLFTGLHPWEHGVPRNGTVLAGEHHTLAERLADAGFATGAIVSSFPLDPRFGYDQGFDVFVHEFEQVLSPSWEEKWTVDGGRFYQLDDAVTERGLALLDELGAGDQFLWLHYFDPHEPYGDRLSRPLRLEAASRASQKGEEAYGRILDLLRRHYDQDVTRLDASLGRIFERLDADAERFETHVVMTSDHGESFGEHGALGHGWRVTREQVHAPLVIVSPRVEPAVRTDTAGTADLMTTLLALAGLHDASLPGRDLLEPAAAGEGRAVGMTGVPAHPIDPATDERRERFYVARGGALHSGTSEHVLEDDVLERPVADETVAAPLRRLFAEFEAALAGRPVEVRMDPETREALKRLGYLESDGDDLE